MTPAARNSMVGGARGRAGGTDTFELIPFERSVDLLRQSTLGSDERPVGVNDLGAATTPAPLFVNGRRRHER